MKTFDIMFSDLPMEAQRKYTEFSGNKPENKDFFLSVSADIEDDWISDDITFCPHEDCEMKTCMRHQSNIRNKKVPHSYSVETPEDCPKKN